MQIINVKRVILVLPKQPPTVPQMLAACSKLGTPHHIVAIQANTLGEQLAKSQDSLREKLEKALEAPTKTIEKNSHCFAGGAH